MVGGIDLAREISESVADRAGIKLRTELLHLNPDMIEPDPDQPRKEFDEEGLIRLADSLRGHGQLQPVVVVKLKGSPGYRLVSGERRWRAAKLARIRRLEAKLIIGGDILSLQLIENLLREDLKPVEQARAYKAIMDKEGWSMRELARRLNLEHSGIAKAMKLLKLKPEIQEAVDSGKLPHTTAYEISRQPAEKQVPLARAAVEGKIKGDDLRQKPATPAPAPPRRPLTLGGAATVEAWSQSYGRVRVEVSGYRDTAALIDALEKALKAARAGKTSLAGGVGRPLR